MGVEARFGDADELSIEALFAFAGFIAGD